MSNPWYAFYPGDYGRDTAHLSLAEDGAYRRLLDYSYATGKPIPTHVEQVFRICRAFVPEEQDAVRSVLKQFFAEQPDGWHNPRVQKELCKSNEIRDKRVRAGKISAAKRAHSASTPVGTPVSTHAEHVFTQPQPQPQEPTTTAVAPQQQSSSEASPSRRKKPQHKRRTRAVVLSAYPQSVTDVVNSVLSSWPRRQPNGDKIRPDMPMLAARVDQILRDSEEASPELLLRSAQAYLAEPRKFYRAPQYFFGPSNGTQPPWADYARMIVHQTNEAHEAEASESGPEM